MKNDKFDCHKCPNRSENVISGEMINFGSINTENNTQQNDISQEPDIQTGSLKIVTQDNIGQLPEFYQIGDIYMDLILNNPKNTQILVNLSVLQDIYTAGSGISIQDRVISNIKTVSWGELGGSLSDQADLTDILSTKCNTDLSNFPNSFWEKIRSIIARSTWQIMTDDEILTQLKELKCSTFDLSKFTVVGSPNITDDGIASGFDGSNYITQSIDFSKPFKLEFKIKTPSSVPSSVQYFLLTSTRGLVCQYSTTGVLDIKASTTAWDDDLINTTFSAQTNTEYLIEIEWTGTNYTCKINGEQIYSNSSTSQILAGNLQIGGYPLQDASSFLGSIDLKQFSITVDGVEVFSGNKTGIDTIKPDNFKVITNLLAYTYDTHTIYAGSLSTTNNVLNHNLYNADGSYYTGEDWKIVSTTVDDVTTYSIEYNGNSATRNSGSDIILTTVNGTVDAGFKITEDGIAYPRVDGRFNIIDSGISLSDSSTDWEIESEAVLTGNIMNDREYFTGSYPSQGRIVDVELNTSGQFKAGFHIAGNTIVSATISSVPTTVGTKIRYIVGRKDTTCYLELYINDNYFNRATQTASSDVQTPSQRISFGNYKADYSRTCFAAINLNKTYIRKRGNLVYQPCLKIPYTESKTGSKIVDSIYRDRVNDMANQSGFAPYYTLSDTNFTLPMGEIYGFLGKLQKISENEIGLPVPTLTNILQENEIWLEGAEVSKTTYAKLYAIYGDDYGIPVDSSNFVLPDFRDRVMQGIGSGGSFGYIEAGLPNITGQFIGGNPNGTVSGAFEIVNDSNSTQTGTSYPEAQMRFDASRSSSIYKNDVSTVQPPAIKVRVKTRFE